MQMDCLFRDGIHWTVQTEICRSALWFLLDIWKSHSGRAWVCHSGLDKAATGVCCPGSHLYVVLDVSVTCRLSKDGFTAMYKKTRSFHGKIYLFTFMIRVVDPKEFFAFVTNGSINYGQLSIILALPSREANGKSSQKWFPLVKMTETCKHFHTP